MDRVLKEGVNCSNSCWEITFWEYYGNNTLDRMGDQMTFMEL